MHKSEEELGLLASVVTPRGGGERNQKDATVISEDVYAAHFGGALGLAHG